MYSMLRRSVLLLLFSLGACVSIPSGPSVMALPGSGKTFDQFRNDDFYCKQYASEQVSGVTPNQASISSGLGSAAVGTGLGAAAGAALGGGTGAAIGAGSGLLGGGWWEAAPPANQDILISNATIWVIYNACTPRVIASR